MSLQQADLGKPRLHDAIATLGARGFGETAAHLRGGEGTRVVVTLKVRSRDASVRRGR